MILFLELHFLIFDDLVHRRWDWEETLVAPLSCSILVILVLITWLVLILDNLERHVQRFNVGQAHSADPEVAGLEESEERVVEAETGYVDSSDVVDDLGDAKPMRFLHLVQLHEMLSFLFIVPLSLPSLHHVLFCAFTETWLAVLDVSDRELICDDLRVICSIDDSLNGVRPMVHLVAPAVLPIRFCDESLPWLQISQPIWWFECAVVVWSIQLLEMLELLSWGLSW